MKKINPFTFLFISILLFSSTSLVRAANSPATKETTYTWVGKQNSQFTEQEYRDISVNYNFVVLHMGDMTFESSKHLHQLNPNIKTFAYWRTNDMPIGSLLYESYGFQNAFYLRDSQGNKIPKTAAGYQTIIGYYLDFTKPAFRTWALNTMNLWFQDGQFDGIALDELIPLSHNNLDESTIIALGENKLAAWNLALFDFAKSIKEKFPNKLVIYNNHSYSLLNSNLDGMLEEAFCYQDDLLPADQLLNHINLLQQYGQQQKIILEKDNYRNTLPLANDRKHIGRYCYGAFLMGYVPGYGRYKFGPGYFFSGEITTNAPEINIPLGQPKLSYENNNSLLSRKFSNGYVYVNLSNTNKTVTLPTTLTLVNEGIIGQTYNQGQNLTILPQDALFFVKNTSGIAIMGDLNRDGKVDLLGYFYIVSALNHNSIPQSINADVNRDGLVNLEDRIIIVNIIKGGN